MRKGKRKVPSTRILLAQIRHRRHVKAVADSSKDGQEFADNLFLQRTHNDMRRVDIVINCTL